MKFKDKYKISEGYEDLFSFKDEKDELDYEAHMLMFRFLRVVEKINSDGRIHLPMSSQGFTQRAAESTRSLLCVPS